MTLESLTIEARRELCMSAKDVTLNGKKAAIVGWADEHAIVFQLDTYLSAKFSWALVARVVDLGGQFTGTVR